ncbi:MAG: ATP synthase F1 subunit epsilon [Planctomycetota bacterium]|nr:ATP synthase F1 subunit epsilon [Planctomycetota bacterium]
MGLTCRVVTPDTTYFDGEADRLNVPAWNGKMEFRQNHSPLIARLGYGVLTIQVGSEKTSVAIYGGFVKVADNEVVVLAGGAERGSDIDSNDAKKLLAEAKAEYDSKRLPAVSELEASEIAERLWRAEARYAASAGKSCPIYQV